LEVEAPQAQKLELRLSGMGLD